ncbi:MAG: DUF255 domain-containing protein [Cyanobacteria bacterium HKST-UBA02]|nr:DUF255 domain-containing protein [Cyanobacteria bacterium HKST-UBA02]
MALPDRLETTTTPDWLLGFTALFLLLRSVVAIGELIAPPQVIDRVKWRTAEDGIKESMKTRKPAFFYFTLQKCPACDQIKSTTFSDKRIAAFLEKHFVPIQVRQYRVEQDGDCRPFENKRAVELYKYYYSSPEIAVVAPIMLRTERPVGYSALRVSWGINRQEIIDRMQEGREWQPEPEGPGQVHWVSLANLEAEKKETGKLPLYFFMKARDFHCDRVRSEIFNDDDIAKIIDEKYLPVMMVDHSLLNRKDDSKMQELVERFDIHEYPCTVIADDRGENPLYLYGAPGKDTCKSFIERAEAKLRKNAAKTSK